MVFLLMPAYCGYNVKETIKQVLLLLCVNICSLFIRYLEEFEKKIPRAEMLELQVIMLFPFFF